MSPQEQEQEKRKKEMFHTTSTSTITSEKVDPLMIGTIQDTFKMFDQDSSGGLDPFELKGALEYLDYDVSLPTALSLLKENDFDGNNQLDVDEFANLILTRVPRNVCVTFSAFANDQGFLTPAALKKALSFLCIDEDSKSTRAILNSNDVNNDGRLGLLGFSDLVSQLKVAQFWLTVDPTGSIRELRLKILAQLVKAPKEPVSLHSLAAVAATGMFLVATVPMISPGFSENGVPHLFNFNNFGLDAAGAKLTTFVFALVGVSGSFRLPPNSPLLRRHFFNFTTLQCVLNYMLQNSNVVAIGGESRYTFDLLTANPGCVAFWVVFVLSNAWTMKLVSEAFSAPEKARSVVPFDGKAIPLAAMTALMTVLMTIEIPGCFLTHDKAAFADVYVPFAQTHYNTWVFPQCFFVEAGMSFVMLFATLLFERKISQAQCTLFSFLAFEPVLEALLGILDEVKTNPESIAFAEYNNEVFGTYYIYQVLTLISVGAAIHGIMSSHMEQAEALEADAK